MFTRDNAVMVLVDVQGQLAQLMYRKEALLASLEIMIKGMKALGVPIIWLEQIPAKLGATTECLAMLMKDQTPIEKHSFSCCAEPAFMQAFDACGRREVLLTGIETHICVCQAGIDLMDQGCQVQVVADCVSSRTPENRQIGLDRLAGAGAEITSVEMAFFELMKTARCDAFKQVVSLIK
ncbi:isochorismatase family protein [Desulfobacter vibrioformis]|uniref:isochorismatase family protein n=1 Tax=Desulfobacter vibrioformis TaxID=34031 RepID=UPI0005527EBF|nr:isochorismatase family protein [Desulfobacter vibrioformis]